MNIITHRLTVHSVVARDMIQVDGDYGSIIDIANLIHTTEIADSIIVQNLSTGNKIDLINQPCISWYHEGEI